MHRRTVFWIAELGMFVCYTADDLPYNRLPQDYPGGKSALLALLQDVFALAEHYGRWECDSPVGTITAMVVG